MALAFSGCSPFNSAQNLFPLFIQPSHHLSAHCRLQSSHPYSITLMHVLACT